MEAAKCMGKAFAAFALMGGLSFPAQAQIGSGWTPANESVIIQTSVGSLFVPSFAGIGGLFEIPPGPGRAVESMSTLPPGSEQFQGDMTVTGLAGDRIGVKATFMSPGTPWLDLGVEKSPGGSIIYDIQSGTVLSPYTVGTMVRINTIVSADESATGDIYINGSHAEKKTGGVGPFFDEFGVWATAIGTGPATVTWENVQFWTGGGKTFTISASASGNGSITPSGVITAPQASDQTFTVTPDAGFQVGSLVVDGAQVFLPIGATTYTFANVEANHTINASFVPLAGPTKFNIPGSAVTASDFQSPNVPANTVDGDLGTRWLAQGDPQWIQYDLGAVGTVNFVKVAVDQGTIRVQAFDIQTSSDGTTFATVAAGLSSSGTTTALETYNLPSPASARFVRLLCHGSGVNTWNSLTEVEIWGSSSGRPFTITARAAANGSISPAGDVSVASGAGQCFTITPNPGFVINDVLVDGSSVGAVSSFCFTNVQADHSISASFKSTLAQFTIATNAGPDGSVSRSVTVDAGGSVTILAVANAGFHVRDVLVDGVSAGAVASVPFKDVQANHTVSAVFQASPPEFTITSSSGPNGLVSPSLAVNAGGSATVTITPDAGFEVNDVQVDGVSSGALASVPFANLQASHTVSASFVPATVPQFTIAASPVTGGSIRPSRAVVTQGNNIMLGIIPNSSNSIVNDVTIDGSSIGETSGAPFVNVQANHTVGASFKPLSKNAHTIRSPGAGLSPVASANAGDNFTVEITPNSGSVVADVNVDGLSVGPVTSFTFKNIQADHAINGTFASSGRTLAGSSGDGWHALPIFPAATGTFTATFDATPTVSPENAVVGLSSGAATAPGDNSCSVRFNPSGQVDACNGTGYVPTKLNYLANVTYHFRLVVNMTTHTYSAFVTAPGGLEQAVGSNYAFRRTANPATSLDHWNLTLGDTPPGCSLTATNLNP